MQFQFAVPKIICSPGASKNVAQLVPAAGSQKVLCIYDKGVKAAGIVDPVLDAMREAGLCVFTFDEVYPTRRSRLWKRPGRPHVIAARTVSLP